MAGSEPDREVIVVASDYAQSKDIVFASAVRFVRRQPWLDKHIAVKADTLVYRESVKDERTGARHIQEHIMRAVPARDARSLHGVNPTLVIIDETWAQKDYQVIEALAPSPTRRVSRTLYSTYAGLRSQMKEGNPLWDLWQRWKSNDPHLFVSYIGGPDGWHQVPWITERFIETQRRKFSAVPSKFKRLWENEWATDDTGSFLTGEEIRDAIDPDLSEPATGSEVVRYTLGVDLGLTNDWTAIVVSHIGPDHRLMVDAVRFWRGTRQRPVSITAVEHEIVSLSQRFKINRVTLDQWQSQLLAERLAIRQVPNVFTVAVDPSRLDRMATALKHIFSSRLIRIPRHPELIEQLETIVGVEQKRRDLVRFTSGSGNDAGRHDDIVIALALSMEGQHEEIGRAVLPATFRECYREYSVPDFGRGACFLFGGNYIPSGCPCCKACAGWQHVRAAYQQHQAQGRDPVDIRTFKRLYVQNNDFVARWHVSRWAEMML